MIYYAFFQENNLVDCHVSSRMKIVQLNENEIYLMGSLNSYWCSLDLVIVYPSIPCSVVISLKSAQRCRNFKRI